MESDKCESVKVPSSIPTSLLNIKVKCLNLESFHIFLTYTIKFPPCQQPQQILDSVFDKDESNPINTYFLLHTAPANQKTPLKKYKPMSFKVLQYFILTKFLLYYIEEVFSKSSWQIYIKFCPADYVAFFWAVKG